MSEPKTATSRLKTVYVADVEVLSPVHIGTGKTLQRSYDYTVHQNQTWRIDEDALFAEVYDRSADNQQALNRLLGARPAEELINPQDYRDHPEFFRYHLPGQPRAEGRGAELRECIKDSRDQPYLPGSSLKGALRTVLAWSIFRSEKMTLDRRQLGDNRSWAGQPVERQIFGSDPNHNLLRALQVSDSTSAAKTALMLANVQVVAGSRPQSPIEVEAIKPGTQFTLTLTLDEHLLSQDISQRLGWKDRGEQLRKIAVTSRNWTGARARSEVEHFDQRSEMTRIVEFYRRLAHLRAKLKDSGDFILQMSWGGGWGAKTLGDLIKVDPDQLEQIITRYRLSKSRERRAGDPFPRSRRIYFDRSGPAMPMGWVLVHLRERQP